MASTSSAYSREEDRCRVSVGLTLYTRSRTGFVMTFWLKSLYNVRMCTVYDGSPKGYNYKSYAVELQC